VKKPNTRVSGHVHIYNNMRERTFGTEVFGKMRRLVCQQIILESDDYYTGAKYISFYKRDERSRLYIYIYVRVCARICVSRIYYKRRIMK